MSKNPASPETIASLIENSKNVIRESEELLGAIEKVKTDIQSVNISHDKSLEFLYILFEILSGSISGMYEGLNSLYNMLQTESLYEKRYNMQMMNLCQFEWCKLLLGKDRKGVLFQLYKLFENCNDKSTIEYLQTLIKLVKTLGSNCNIELRNITAHYDEPLKMYQTLVLLNDEDIYAKRLGVQMEIHDKILILTNSVLRLVVANQNKQSIERQCINNLQDTDMQALINEVIAGKNNERLDLKAVISKQLSNAWSDIESSNKLSLRYDMALSFMQQKQLDTAEINPLKSLIEMHWIVSFMRHDLACSMNNYLNASSMIERSVCLRRIYLIEVPALSHLYGYNNTAQHRSIWGRLNEIPEFVSNPLSNMIENELKELTSNLDSDKRNLYTHFREDEQLNLSSRWDAFKNMNHVEELMQLHKLIILCNKIDSFLKSILLSINESHEIKLQETLKPIFKIRELGIKFNNQEIIDISDKFISMFNSVGKE